MGVCITQKELMFSLFKGELILLKFLINKYIIRVVMNDKVKKVLAIILALIIAIGLYALITWGVQSLWNWIAPLFWSNAPILTFWQTLGVMLLVRVMHQF